MRYRRTGSLSDNEILELVQDAAQDTEDDGEGGADHAADAAVVPAEDDCHTWTSEGQDHR